MEEKQTALGNMHQLFLEALRHREQEIFRYLAILGPALGGFMWLIQSEASNGVVVTGRRSNKGERIFRQSKFCGQTQGKIMATHDRSIESAIRLR